MQNDKLSLNTHNENEIINLNSLITQSSKGSNRPSTTSTFMGNQNQSNQNMQINNNNYSQHINSNLKYFLNY
jgi:hypothetical protein